MCVPRLRLKHAPEVVGQVIIKAVAEAVHADDYALALVHLVRARLAWNSMVVFA